MKYITEEDLRDLYRKEPFTNYALEPGVRLTPGARQFLMDKGITGEKAETISPPAEKTDKKAACCHKKLTRHMKSVEALFLLTEEELLGKDICLAQSVISLGKQFGAVKNSLNGTGCVDNLTCKECSGIHCSNYSEDLEDCFEITEFHVQLPKGREIIILHRLRCTLYELVSEIEEQLEGSENNGQREDITGKIYQIINTLSQLICAAVGGNKCQRKA